MRLLSFILAAVILTGCGSVIVGNGKIVEVGREIPNFQNLSGLGSIDIEIQPADKYSVRIIGDDNVIPYVITDVVGDELRVSYKKGVNISNSHVRVVVSAPFINNLKTTGSGDIRSNGMIINNKIMEITSTGSGDVNLVVDAPAIKITGAGSGDFTLSGQTRDVECGLSGSGDFDSRELKSENAKIRISGSSNVKVFASISLAASIAGSGNILYWGNPSLNDVKVSGSGKIKAGE